jgi:uncharacterized protein
LSLTKCRCKIIDNPFSDSEEILITFNGLIGPLVITIAMANSGAAAGNDARLAEAVRSRNTHVIQALLAERVDVNGRLPDGATALHWAVHWNDDRSAELLIRAGANVNVRNDNGITPLALACENGDAPLIEKLLQAGADPNATVREAETPLMLVARTGNTYALKLLLSQKVDVNARETWNGQTALMWAVAEGHAAATRLLIDHAADIHARSNSGFTALLFAARQGKSDIVQMLLNAGANVNELRPDGATPLLLAVINGHEDLVDLLLDKGADPNIEGGLTAHARVGERAKPLKVEFDPDRDYANPSGNNDQNARQKGPAINLWGTPLHAAVSIANPLQSSVHWVVRVDKLRVVKSLLEHGANVNAKMRSDEPYFAGVRYHAPLTGATPFLLASRAGDVALMRLLLTHGADPKLVTRNKTTALMLAAGLATTAEGQDLAPQSRFVEAVKLLLDLGADVNAANDLNETALHGAAYRGLNDIVQLLVDKGATLNAKDKQGRTPLNIAEGVVIVGTYSNPHTAALLRRLGAGIQR